MSKALLFKASSLLGILLTINLLFCFLNQSHAMEVTLTWEANTEPDLAGYYIYYRTESSPDYKSKDKIEICLSKDKKIYSNAKAVKEVYGDGKMAIICKLIPLIPLNPGEEEGYFFQITAFDTSGLESAPSNTAGTKEGGTENDALSDNNDIIIESYSVGNTIFRGGENEHFITGPRQAFTFWDNNPAIFEYAAYRPINSITMGCDYCHAFPPETHSATTIDCSQCHPTHLRGTLSTNNYHINGVPDLWEYDKAAIFPAYLNVSPTLYPFTNSQFSPSYFDVYDSFGLPVSTPGIYNIYGSGMAFLPPYGTPDPFLSIFLPVPFADNIPSQGLMNGNNSLSPSFLSGYQNIFGLWPFFSP